MDAWMHEITSNWHFDLYADFWIFGFENLLIKQTSNTSMCHNKNEQLVKQPGLADGALNKLQRG